MDTHRSPQTIHVIKGAEEFVEGFYFVSPATISQAEAESEQAYENEDTADPDDDDYVAPEYAYEHALAQATETDLPADLFEKYGDANAPMFVSYGYSCIAQEHVEAVVSELQARGFTVVREDQ